MRKILLKYRLFLSIFSLVALLIPAVAGCTNDTTAPADVGASGSAILTVVKGTQTSTYTMKSLKSLPITSGWAGQMSSTGTITGPYQYKGVSMKELLNAVGGITENDAVRVSAKDGYAMTLSYNQITTGSGFPILDSTTGKEVAAANTPTVFIAYEQDGKPLDDTVGPLRLGIMTSDKQVTDGHWWVKWTQKIEVVGTVKPWSLKLEGAITENMDQATFESGAAIGCHGVKWTDDQGRVWEGIPLWYLIGRVDDAVDTHKGDAFSDVLADKGYDVHIVSSDGQIVQLTAAEVKRNDALIVAYKRDGAALPENQWPLRLVGSTLSKDKMLGKLFKIKIEFGAATAAPTTTAPASTVASTTPVLNVVNGTKTANYSIADLQKLQSYTGNGGTKNKTGVIAGPNLCVGVPLLTVINSVGTAVTPDQSIKVTSSDGYTKTLPYDQIINGTFTMYDKTGTAVTPTSKPVVCVVYSVNGTALDAATGPVELGILTGDSIVSDGSAWVKMITKIEVVSPAK